MYCYVTPSSSYTLSLLLHVFLVVMAWSSFLCSMFKSSSCDGAVVRVRVVVIDVSKNPKIFSSIPPECVTEIFL